MKQTENNHAQEKCENETDVTCSKDIEEKKPSSYKSDISEKVEQENEQSEPSMQINSIVDDAIASAEKDTNSDSNKSKENDPRTQRRIRNKDRPTMAIYQPGMLSKRKQSDTDTDSKSSCTISKEPI